ncbi:MAG: tetratricopeptide repeat protein [Planctomycetota bacterium]
MISRLWCVCVFLCLSFIAQGDILPDAAKPTLVEGRDLLNKGEYEAASRIFDELRQQPSPSHEATSGLARCYLATGKYEEGYALLIESTANPSADRHLFLVFFANGLGRYIDALEHAKSAVQADPKHSGARLEYARLLELLGRKDEVLEAYRWFDQQIVGREEMPKDAEWLTNVGLGFLRFSVLARTNVPDRTKHVLNKMLQAAYGRVDLTYWPARIAAGDLLREKYNNSDQDGSVSDYLAALRINPNLPEAQVGLGEVALENWQFEEVEKRAGLALEVNPNFGPALHLLSKKCIYERRYSEAVAHGQRALKINPNDLTAMSIIASARVCMLDQPGRQEMQSRLEAIRPPWSEFHRYIGEALYGIRQYRDSEREYLRAIELDANNANARTELGMMYMQWGEESKAREALEAAWTLDPFNERTKFTLDLFQSLEKFARHETANFIIKHDAEKDPGLGVFLGTYLEEIFEPVTRDFGATLDEKTIIEIFPTHAGFGVRTTGRPWIPTVGACSGRLIAMSSPRKGEDRTGPFNMARVLKHEFTHVVTLGATKNRVPHWLTEGLAVYEEDSPRDFDWMQLLVQAIRRDDLFTLDTLNWGFMRPKRPTDRTMAYAQSEWMCEFIVERFGYDAIGGLLAGFRDGKTQPRIFEEHLKISPDEFDKDFAAWARKQASTWGWDLTPPEDVKVLREKVAEETAGPDLLTRLAQSELEVENPDEAMNAARKALELKPDESKAMQTIVTVLCNRARFAPTEPERRSIEDEVLPLLERLRRADSKSWPAAKFAGEIFLRRKEWDQAVTALQDLQRLMPYDPASWRGLAGIYLDREQDDLALSQLVELARVDIQDADVPFQIAAIHQRAGRLKEAAYWYRQSLFIDPFDARTHRALGDAAMRVGDTRLALNSYRMLTSLEPKNPRYFETAAVAANKLGDTQFAQEMARKAVALDPQSSAKALLP